ncbi:MAG: helix-turn-helix domain-containing protein, partial [Leptospirales bacterium]
MTEPEKPTLTRKERDQARKRNEILDAAERLFFSKGYEETSINEIAVEAEFAKGTLYLYFSGKSEIYLAIVNRSLDIIHQMILKKVPEAKNGAQKLKVGGDAFSEFFDKY